VAKEPLPNDEPAFSKKARDLIGEFRGVPLDEPASMRRRPTRAMAPLIEELLVKYQVGRHSTEQEIRDHWAELVGAANAAYSHPVRIERGRSLLVLVSHAVVRNELFLHREAILEKVGRLPGCSQVQEIRFVAG